MVQVTEAQVWYVLIALTALPVIWFLVGVFDSGDRDRYDADSPEYDPYCMRPGHDCGAFNAGPCNGLPRTLPKEGP